MLARTRGSKSTFIARLKGERRLERGKGEEELERERLATEAERQKLEEEARIEELMASRPSYVQQDKRGGDSGGWGGKWRGNKKRKDDWRKGKRR